MGGAQAEAAKSDEDAEERFGGRYRALELLKRAHGIETWRAADGDGRDVVLRSVAVDALSAAGRKWLELEVDVLNRLDRSAADGAGPALAIGETDGALFLVRPFVAGATLEARLRSGSLAVADLLTLSIHLARSLEAIHARGVVHGDIKPSNIVLEGDSPASPVLVDFGLARHMFLDGGGDVPVDLVRYLAPEQSGLLERGVDRRADLYALGLVLYEAAAGCPPFDGGDAPALLRQHLTAAPPPPSALDPCAPRALDRIIARLLRKDARDRYQTARGVRADLEELADALGGGRSDPDMIVGARDARDSLTEPAFTGRAAELGALEEGLAAARAGRGGVVLVEGESGMGKTWLLEELARRAGPRALWILRGRGRAHEAQRPFQILSQVAREVAAAAAPGSARAARLVEGAGSVGPVVCASLPALRPLFGEADAPEPDREAETPADPKAQERSQAALAALLDSLGSADEPALVLFDDAQWADAPTLRLLGHWHAQSGPRHVLVALSFRSSEVDEAHPARVARPLAQVQLGRLRDEEVREQIASMAGELPDAAVELVLAQAAGNPFLVSALLGGLVDSGALAHGPGGWQLADGAAEPRVADWLADLLLARISRLPAPAGQLLAVGALLGRSFDPVVAGELAGIAAEQAVRAVQELRGVLLWVDPAGTRCTFPHDRIREFLLARLPAEERRRLHREAAWMLEDGGGDREFELAYHYEEAGEPARALPHALGAARRARAQHDMELAERYYRMARRGAGDDDPAIRYRIARGLGDVLLVRSRYEECERELDEAFALAPDAAARADVEERRAQLALKRGRLAEAAEHGESALRLIGRRVPRRAATCALILIGQLLIQVLHTRLPRLFVGRRPLAEAERDLFAIRLYHSLSAPYFFARGAVWALWAHLHEMNLSERYPPTSALGRAYGLHGAMCSGFPSLFERAIRYTRVGAALCGDRGDLWGQARAIQFLALGLCGTGRYQEAAAAAEESARLFERAGDTWEANGPLAWGALARYRMGDLAGARDAAVRLHERGRSLDDAHGIAFGIDVWARAVEGRLPADLVRGELDRRSEHVQTSSALAQAEAIRLLAEGRPAEAETLIDTWLGRLKAEGAFLHEANVSLVVYRVTALRRQAEEIPAIEPGRRAAVLARAGRASRRALKTARKFRNCEPHALREAALVAAMTGDSPRALALVDRSVEAATRLGARYELALSREVRGRLGAAAGRAGAVDELDAARRELHALRVPLAGAPPEVAGSAAASLIGRFRAILEAGHRIARSRPAEVVYESLREGALALLPAQRCAILAPVGSGEAPVALGDAHPVSQEMVQEALAAGRPVVRPTDGPTGGDSTLARAAVRSALCAPIQVRGEPAALLYLTHAEVSDAFGDEAQQIAGFLTALAGAALENSEGLLQIQEFSRELEARVEARTAELARANAELADSLRRLEDTQLQLLHAGRMAAVGTLIAGLSHELNNPLTVIVGNVENLIRLMPAGDDDYPRRIVEAIDRQARRAARLIDTLLRFSRSEPEAREEVDAGDLVRTAAELVSAEARRRDVDLRVSIVDAPPAVRVSHHEIESALVNIATNALQATPPRGAVEISVAAEARQGIAGVTFAVRDTGVGISAESLPQIFDPFFTTKPSGQGTGLGLSIAREAVTAHGGAIEVDSAPGAGTTMKLWLPQTSA